MDIAINLSPSVFYAACALLACLCVFIMGVIAYLETTKFDRRRARRQRRADKRRARAMRRYS